MDRGQAARRKRASADQRDLVALGAEKLAREATLNGRAEGEIAAGRVTLLKLGAGADVSLLLASCRFRKAIAAPPRRNRRGAARASGSRGRRSRHGSSRPSVATSVPLRLADGCRRPLHPRRRGLRPPARAEDRRAARQRPGPRSPPRSSSMPQGRVGARRSPRATPGAASWCDWPVDEATSAWPIELSGLPVFDRDRRFAGFRGFGVCRDIGRGCAAHRQRRRGHAAAAHARRAGQGAAVPPRRPPTAEPAPPPQPHEQRRAASEPALSPGEHSAFQELARELNERLKKGRAGPSPEPIVPASRVAPPPRRSRRRRRATATPRATRNEGRPILDRLPVGILVYRLNNLLYANRAFLDWTGYPPSAGADRSRRARQPVHRDQGRSAGPGAKRRTNGGKTLTITTVNGNQKPVEGRLFSATWNNENALVLMIGTQRRPTSAARRAERCRLRRIERENQRAASAILDTATDGVLVLDRAGRVLSANRSAAGAVRLRGRRVRRTLARRPAGAGEPARRARPSRPAGARRRDRRASTPAARRSAACARAGWCRSTSPWAASRTATSSARCCATSPPGSAARRS